MYVLIEYGESSMRMPCLTKCSNQKTGQQMINTILKWGIDIRECKEITEEEAKKLLDADKVDFEDES